MTDTNTPQLPGSLADCKPYLDLSRYQLSLTNNSPEPHYLLDFQGVGFSALGGIQAVTGQKKNGKNYTGSTRACEKKGVLTWH